MTSFRERSECVPAILGERGGRVLLDRLTIIIQDFIL